MLSRKRGLVDADGLFHSSSIAVVYQPYLGRTMKSLAETCQRVALEKVNEASANVAAIAERLLRESNVEAIPGGL